MTVPAGNHPPMHLAAPGNGPVTLAVSTDATPSDKAGPVPVVSSGLRASRRNWRPLAWLLTIALPLVVINLMGMPYYTASLAERMRHPQHEWYRPSGVIGLSAGFLAVAIFAFLWLYPLRKKFRRLAFLGSLGRWMDVHIATALALPLLLAIHSSWRADGLIGLGLLSMLVVIASGVVGRYLYVRIPRTRTGVELGREEVAGRRRELIGALSEATGLSVAAVEQELDLGPTDSSDQRLGQIAMQLLTNDLRRWRRSAALHRRWAGLSADGRPLSRAALSEVMRLARQEMSLHQQMRMLDATHRVFRFWHVAHRPFAVTALIAVVIHVVVVVAMGAVHF